MQIRTARLEELGTRNAGVYADMDRIFQELEWAQDLFAQNKRWPVLDVTAKAIEENAVEVQRIIHARFPHLKELIG